MKCEYYEMRMVLCDNISPKMGFKTSCLVFLVILVCASGVRRSEEIVEEDKVIRQLAHILTGEMQKDKAERLLSICNIDLTQLVDAVNELDVCLSENRSYWTNEINFECLSLAKETIWRILSRLHLHSQAKQTLRDCIKILQEKEDSQVYYSKHSDPIFPKPSIKRRNVGSRLLQSIAEVPASAPLESPFSSPEVSPSPDPSSLFPPSQNPASSPKEPGFQPSSAPLPLPDNVIASPNSGAIAPAENKGKNHKPVIIAVVVTASVTFIVAALLFLCCTKFCKGGSRVRKNDERPLLSLSMSDFSIGASPNFYGYSSSIQEGKPENQSNISNQQKKYSDSNFHAASNGRTSVQEFQVNEAFAGVDKSNVESLGGLGNINGQAMPTLKPPPGRIQVSSSIPLPPQPASSFKTPSNAGPPPPPPATPSLPPSAPPPPVAPLPKPPLAAPLRPPANAGHPPGPPPLPPPVPTGKAGIHAPPPPKMGGFPPRPPQQISLGSNAARPSKPPLNPASSDGKSVEDDSDAPKAKLKPFFWDKVLANPGHSMVWHQIKSGSFQFNEEMIESLFGYAPVDKNKNERKKETSSQDPSTHYIQIIDSKKAQNLSILLRALNVTKEEICDAIIEGNELHAELIQNLLKMAPTAEEELKLRLFGGEVSQLSLADRFLKALVDIPFAFKRLEALHFMCTLQEDVTTIKESFAALEVACQELKNSRLFLKLLEAVLKTGNRMNDGTFRGGAQAFKLDTLLKLSDVKGTDGKTTLLLFVVQEIIRSEGARAARTSSRSDDSIDEASLNTQDYYRSLGLQAISGLGNELENVKRAAGIDLDGLRGTVTKLSHALAKSQEFLNTNMKNLDENSEFHRTLKSFVQNAEVDIMTLVEEEKRIMSLVKSTGDYFHGNTSKDEGLRLFLIVRDFLIMVDKACREVSQVPKKTHKKTASSPDIREAQSPAASSDLNLRLFPAIKDRRIDNSSSDEEDP